MPIFQLVFGRLDHRDSSILTTAVGRRRFANAYPKLGFWRAMENRGDCCLWIVDDVPSGLSAEEMERAWNARWTGVRLCLPHGAENTVRLAAHSILGFYQPGKHSPCSLRIAGAFVLGERDTVLKAYTLSAFLERLAQGE